MKCKKCRREVIDDPWEKLSHVARYHRKHFMSRLPRVAMDRRIDPLTKAAIAAMGFVSRL